MSDVVMTMPVASVSHLLVTGCVSGVPITVYLWSVCEHSWVFLVCFVMACLIAWCACDNLSMSDMSGGCIIYICLVCL